MGLTEQQVFPEIDPDKVTFVQGMDITFVTSTRNDDEARELLRASACRSARREPMHPPDTGTCRIGERADVWQPKRRT